MNATLVGGPAHGRSLETTAGQIIVPEVDAEGNTILHAYERARGGDQYGYVGVTRMILRSDMWAEHMRLVIGDLGR